MTFSNWQFTWLAHFYDHVLFHRSYDILDSLLELEPGDRVLDVGGGTGEFRDHLSLPDDVRYVVADINQAMLKQGRKRDVLPLRADVKQLPFENRTFDVVLFLDSLHHIGSPGDVIPGIKPLVDEETQFVFEEFDPDVFVGRLLFWLERLSGMGSRFITPGDLLNEMEQLGFVRDNLRLDGFVYYSTFHLRSSFE